MSRLAAFWACLAAFVALTVALVANPALGDLDESVARLHPKTTWTPLVPWVRTYELLGQRGPTLLVFAPLVVWWAWRRRDRTPVLALVVAELLLNLAVGVIKLGLGRVGPFAAGDAHRFFSGGDIYPSGHVSNAVVLYGLLAWTAPSSWRRWAVGAAVFLSASVGLGTLFLRTHWLSDVVGGWLAGGLVLLTLPWAEPVVERVVASAASRVALDHVRRVLGAGLDLVQTRRRSAARLHTIARGGAVSRARSWTWPAGRTRNPRRTTASRRG